jgi:hypothetical protein
MSGHDERAVAQFRRQIGALLLLKHVLTSLTLWAFLSGVLVLALRTLGVSSITLLWGLLTLPLALIPAILRTRRRLPTRSAILAALDRHGTCGGLLMASEETSLSGWERKLPTVTAPSVQWRNGRAWAQFAGAQAFLFFGLLLPQSLADMGAPPPLDVSRQQAKLEKQIDVLREEALLEPKRAEDLKTKLDQLRREARGNEPARTLDALDHLKELVKKTAKEATESAEKKSQSLGRTDTMLETLKKKGEGSADRSETLKKKDREDADKLDPKTTAEAMEQLKSLTRQAAAENDALKDSLELDRELSDSLDSGSLSKEQMDKLKDLLKDAKSSLSKKLGKMVKADLIDLDDLKKCEGACEGNCEDLLAYLKSKGASKSLCSACRKPGRGGPGSKKDDAPAPLTFGKPTDENGFTFKEEALPPARLQALKESKRLGLSVGTPQKSGSAEPSDSGALDTSAAGGGSASTHVVLPRHRGSVERYFDRSAK